MDAMVQERENRLKLIENLYYHLKLFPKRESRWNGEYVFYKKENDSFIAVFLGIGLTVKLGTDKI